MNEQEPVMNEQEPATPPSGKDWMRGFIQIITQPHRLDALRGANVYKIVVLGALLYGIAYTLSQYCLWLNPVLREQLYYSTNYILFALKQPVAPLPDSFQFTRILGMAIIPVLFLNILPLALLFFVVHRIFTRQPLRFLAVLGIVGYSSSISAIGMLLTVAVQWITGSMGSSFSLGGFMPLSQDYFLNGFFTAVDIFLLWQYVAIATAIVSFMNKGAMLRYLLAAVCLLVYLLFMGARVYMAYQYYIQSAHS